MCWVSGEVCGRHREVTVWHEQDPPGDSGPHQLYRCCSGEMLVKDIEMICSPARSRLTVINIIIIHLRYRREDAVNMPLLFTARWKAALRAWRRRDDSGSVKVRHQSGFTGPVCEWRSDILCASDWMVIDWTCSIAESSFFTLRYSAFRMKLNFRVLAVQRSFLDA